MRSGWINQIINAGFNDMLVKKLTDDIGFGWFIIQNNLPSSTLSYIVLNLEVHKPYLKSLFASNPKSFMPSILFL